MKKCLLLALMVGNCLLAAAQNRAMDHPMQIKNMNMTVQADCFTAITFLEIEFYNPNDYEIEGLYRFQLAPYQVITAFQLDLNGKFRDGSIEEKWKASNAYNTIVGKRIDPALLRLEYGQLYRLNIYPVPAKSSRRITMTIHQPLQQEKDRLVYRFALNRGDTARHFRLGVKTTGCAAPQTDDGLIANENFLKNEDAYWLEKSIDRAMLWFPVSFYFPLEQTNSYCTQEREGKTFFALRFNHQIPPAREIRPKTVTVYWDVSGSSINRNRSKEISFLKQYLQKHAVEALTIIAFGDRVLPARQFYPKQNRGWLSYLLSLGNEGPTRVDHLDFSSCTSDLIFLFSDGMVSYGSRRTKPASRPVYSLNASYQCDSVFLKALSANSGGCFINLTKHTVAFAVGLASITRIQLLSVASLNGHMIRNGLTHTKEGWLLHGTLAADDTVELVYGNRSQIYQKEKLVIKKQGGCKAVGIDRLAMLDRFVSLPQWDWQSVLEFGLEEKIVTAHTAYIVLERIEDYIKYNIAPPKELEEACKERGYITKNTQTLRQQLREKDQYEILRDVTNVYNQYLQRWDAQAGTISLSRKAWQQINNTVGQAGSGSETDWDAFGAGNPGNADEVVVTGYATRSAKSAISISSVGQLAPAGSVEQMLAGRAPGLIVQQSSGFAGAMPSIQIRGASSFSRNQPLFVIDGMPVEGNINDLVSVNDIESITVLKDASAATIYGARGANGVIVINTKKYRPRYHDYYRDNTYRLRDMPDMDYLEEIREIPPEEKLAHYHLLRSLHEDDPVFYIEMAVHFFENGLSGQAPQILLNAAEVSNGDAGTLRAIAYTFESWKMFGEAIDIYQQLLERQPHDISLYRDLAWAQYQAGDHQQCVETFYHAILLNTENYEYYYQSLKASLLSEMNAVIHIHRDSLDLSAIPAGLIVPMPADLRIVLTGNHNPSYFQVKEPGGSICASYHPPTQNGGYMEGPFNHYNFGSYTIKKALKGKYQIIVHYYPHENNTGPSMFRILGFKNFGSKNQSLDIQNIIMNNQRGQVEIGEVSW